MDYLTLNCSFCAAKFKIKLEYAHLKGRCPVCGFRIKPARPDLYEYKPLPMSTADEPQGLLAEDDEWPEPAILIAEEHHAREYRFSDAPVSQTPARPEPEGSKDVFSLGPEYKRGPHEEPLDAIPVGEPPIKLVEPIAEAKPTPAAVVKSAQPKPAKAAPPPSKPAVPLDPILDDVPLPTHAEAAKPNPPVADAPGSPGVPASFQDDVLVRAPPRVGAKPVAATSAEEAKGPRFSAPAAATEPDDAVPYADEAAAPSAKPSEPAGPIIGTYGFIDAPPGTKGIPAPVGEFDHVHASPQVAPLADPPKSKAPEAKWVPPPPSHSSEPPLEAKPATQEELYQYRLSQAELKPYRPPPPPDSPLWTGVWNFAWQTSSLKMLVWFCLGFTAALLVLSWGITLAGMIGEGGSKAVAAGIGLICVILAGIWVTLWTGSYTSACTFKIIDETANGEPAISGPDGGWKEWFVSFLRLGYLLACGLVICGFFFVTGYTAAGTAFLLILWPAVFNVFLLSNLAGESSFTIFHGPMIGKLGGKLGVAFMMYVWTFVLLGIVVTFGRLAIEASAWLALPGGVFIAVCALTYARMMGRVGMQLLVDDSKPRRRKKKRRQKPSAPAPAGTEPEEPDERAALA